MRTFKEYLAEEEETDSGNIGYADLSKHLTPGEIKSIKNTHISMNMLTIMFFLVAK